MFNGKPQHFGHPVKRIVDDFSATIAESVDGGEREAALFGEVGLT